MAQDPRAVSDVSQSTILLFGGPAQPFSNARLGWLIQLRWFALAGIFVAALMAGAGVFPGVRWTVLVFTGLGAAVYNFLLWRSFQRGEAGGGRAGMLQALSDMALLTAVLWAAGGTDCPFISYYVFHVAIVGILAGPRATLVAALAAMAGTGFLALTTQVEMLRIGVWQPRPPWDLFAEAVAFLSTVGTVAYLVTHAMRELRDRERALQSARDNAALEYELLSNTLDQMEAGLEVLDTDGSVVWRNRRAEELAVQGRTEGGCPRTGFPCEADLAGACPIDASLAAGQPGRCRFALGNDRPERIYEMLTFPLAGHGEGARVMNLYVDRTTATLNDQRLLLAERLVSLGRVAQGVAHELNTPLATIRTLASDVRAALRNPPPPSDQAAWNKLSADIDESAELVRDETLRLGRITQSLLAGGDLVRAKTQASVPVAAVVERARALIFAGVRQGPQVKVGQGVDELHVTADPDRLVQVLVNLLQNAYDAVRELPDGHVRIHAQRDGDDVRILIEDDGPGLSAEVREHLFEPFATTKPHGTGLGLYTSYMLVQAMNGELFLEPGPEGGAVATLRLRKATPRGSDAPGATP